MPLHHVNGDLLESSCQALVNPVNCIGVAGAGLAKQFKDRWPGWYTEYVAACRRGDIKPGAPLHEVLLPDGRSILSVPTKRHWQDRSLFRDVGQGIVALAEYCKEARVPSIAIPPLGCGLGGLPRQLVLNSIQSKMGGLPTEVYLYNFDKG